MKHENGKRKTNAGKKNLRAPFPSPATTMADLLQWYKYNSEVSLF
jgi:hypothetical protein